MIVPHAPPMTSLRVIATSDGTAAVHVPAGVCDLESFDEWSLSDDFPSTGRLDYIDGTLWIDLMGANPTKHSALKSEIGMVLRLLCKQLDFGEVYIDTTRYRAAEADLSCEPDVMVVGFDALRTGTAALQPTAKAKDDYDHAIITGAVDLVVEVISPTSRDKDHRDLRAAYFNAGVREYWLADASELPATLTIHRRGDVDFIASAADTDGFTPSVVLRHAFKLETHVRDETKTIRFDLNHRPLA